MEQSQLVELIRTLKPEERAQIQHFSTNPMFNNGRMRAQIIPLLQLCLNHTWVEEGAELEKKKVYELVFPNQPFVEGKLEKVMVEAQKILKSFLIIQRYMKSENEIVHSLDFAEELRSRGLFSRYQQLTVRIQKVLDESPLNDRNINFQYLLEFSKYDEESIRNQAKGDLNIKNTIYALEIDFYLKRLVLLNQLLLQTKLTNLEIPEDIEQLLLNAAIPTKYLSNSILLNINHEIYRLLQKKSPSSSDVQAFFRLLLDNENALDAKSLQSFYTFLRNICVLSISSNYDKPELEGMLHELYKDNLSRGYLHFEGKIARGRYAAVVLNALNAKAFDWTLDFIERYKNEIRDENETRDIYRLNLANYFFATGRFSESLDNIPDTSPFVDFLMFGKRLELKCLYELKSDLLPYKLDSFKMFLSRTSQKLLSANQRQNHTDFANLLHQIVSSNPGDPKRSETLVKRVQEKKQSFEYRWLLEKAKALKT